MTKPQTPFPAEPTEPLALPAQPDQGGVTDASHASRDLVLTALATDDSILGNLVRCYPGRDAAGDGTAWLDAWFRTRIVDIRRRLADGESAEEVLTVPALPASVLSATNCEVRLLTIEPHYFRGFRSPEMPVDVSAPLTMIEGRNSAGKTSLAEALEWLFTGRLIRRELGGLGNARELERCVGNEFRPDGEETWVEAALKVRIVTGDNESTSPITLRRLLLEDYGATTTSTCRSVLLRDGEELSEPEAAALLEQLFGGCPPVLMQHSLRQFVHSAPSARRQYFEQLLQLDELTHLIEKAVVTDARLPAFPSPDGGGAHERWTALKQAVREQASRTRLRRAERADPEHFVTSIENALAEVAHKEFPTLFASVSSLAEAQVTLDHAQQAVRQGKFPHLAALRPTRTIDNALETGMAAAAISERFKAIEDTEARLKIAQEAAGAITQAELAVAQAAARLAQAGLIDPPEAGDQICPVCAYAAQPTLTAARRSAIAMAEPARAALDQASRNRAEAWRRLADWSKAAEQAWPKLLPPQPQNATWTAALEGVPEPVREAAAAVRRVHEEASEALKPLRAALAQVTALAAKPANPAALSPHVVTVTTDVSKLLTRAREYATTAAALEQAVGAQAKADPDYKLRECWIAVAAEARATVDELLWERAKSTAQHLLEKVREALKTVRQNLLDVRRSSFSDGMTEIWKLLRADRYSSFSQLSIPAPRGRGFPIEIEVKARLDDGTRQQDVDALRVFSESQIHVLGLAAFITRAKLLNHKLLILDDPVQSMDEAHFRTFAEDLLPRLLAAGFQALVLTHNGTFARDVSIALADRTDYVALKIEHARKSGCRVEEGVRRLSNRLKRASKTIDDDRVEDGWLQLRKGIERLYLLIQVKHGPKGFKPTSWINHTAEAMWEEAVGAIVLAQHPDTAPRLRDLLTLSNSGAHDKDTRGLTDLELAIKDLRAIAIKFSIHD